MTAAVWGLTGALLLLAVVIGVVGYVWATTSHLDRPSSVEEMQDVVSRALAPYVADFDWPTLDSEPEVEQ